MCLAHSGTKFQLAVDKSVLIPKADYYKGEKMIEDDEDAPPTHYVKVRPRILCKYEVFALHQKWKR